MSTTPHRKSSAPIKNTGGPPPVQRRRRKAARTIHQNYNPTSQSNLNSLLKFYRHDDTASQPNLTLKVVRDNSMTNNQNRKRNLSDTSFGSTRNDSNTSNVSSSAGELRGFQRQGEEDKILDDLKKMGRAGPYRFKPVNELYETDELQTPSITFGGKKKKRRKRKTKRRRTRKKRKTKRRRRKKRKTRRRK